jgi:DNA-3-methyladenine glycosylase
MAITRLHNGADVTRGTLVVRQPSSPSHFDILTTPRIGITKCIDLPLRFLIAGNAFVSKPPSNRQQLP